MTNDIKGVGYAAPCDGCGEEAILGDELFLYDLPVGLSALCLDCGPQENYADLDRYIVTVEYEVFADSRSNAVRQYFIDKERFLTVRNVKKMETTKPEIDRYRHQQDFYDEAGEPVEFETPEDDSDILFWIPLDSEASA